MFFFILLFYAFALDCNFKNEIDDIPTTGIYTQYAFKNTVAFGRGYSPYNATKYSIDENGNLTQMWNIELSYSIKSIWMNDNITSISVYGNFTLIKIIIIIMDM